jgi:hypothetical protein
MMSKQCEMEMPRWANELLCRNCFLRIYYLNAATKLFERARLPINDEQVCVIADATPLSRILSDAFMFGRTGPIRSLGRFAFLVHAQPQERTTGLTDCSCQKILASFSKMDRAKTLFFPSSPASPFLPYTAPPPFSSMNSTPADLLNASHCTGLHGPQPSVFSQPRRSASISKSTNAGGGVRKAMGSLDRRAGVPHEKVKSWVSSWRRQARAFRSETIGEMNIIWLREGLDDLASLRT